jgi:hypothetical protein
MRGILITRGFRYLVSVSAISRARVRKSEKGGHHFHDSRIEMTIEVVTDIRDFQEQHTTCRFQWHRLLFND